MTPEWWMKTTNERPLPIAGNCFENDGRDLVVSYHTTCVGKPCYLVKRTRMAYGSKVMVDTWIEWPAEAAQGGEEQP